MIYPGPEQPVGSDRGKLSRDQVAVRNFLAERAVHLVVAYDSLLELLSNSSLPVAPHLAAHLARDLMEVLPRVLALGSKYEGNLQQRFGYSIAFQKIDVAFSPWMESSEETIVVSNKAYQLLALQCRLAKNQSESLSYSELLMQGLLLPGQPIQTLQKQVETLEKHRNHFRALAHLRYKQEDQLGAETIKEIRERLSVVEALIARLVTPAIDSLGMLNEWLKSQAENGLSDAVSLALVPALAIHFWERLTNASLIKPLHASGYFLPSSRQIVDDKGSYRYLPSPSLRALARLTKLNPSDGIEVWQSLRLELSIDLHHLIDAAIGCQGKQADVIANIILRYLKGGMRPFIERDIFALISHLVEQEAPQTALKFFEQMLLLNINKSQAYDRLRFTYCDAHDIRDEKAQLAIRLLGGELPESCIDLIYSKIKFCDKNHNWHGLTSIEKEDDNHDSEPVVVIIELFRNVIQMAIDSGALTLDKIIKKLKVDDRIIDKRIYIYLLKKYASQELIDPLFRDRALFDDQHLSNEVAKLYRERFSKAEEEVRGLFFTWIDQGPQDGTDPQYHDYWRLRKMSWVRDSLEAQRKIQFETLLEKLSIDALDLKDPSLPALPSRGRVSPYSIEELSKLGISDVVEKVDKWQQRVGSGFRSPSIEGLAQEFGSLISSNAVLWSQHAIVIGNMKPYYVSRAFNGWLTYVRDKGDLNWTALLDLVDNILGRQEKGRQRLNTSEIDENAKVVDHDEKWTRKCIIELISKACDHGAGLELRPRFMAVLALMINDDPASAIISDENFLTRDHVSDALNSARGKVATALCDVAIWTAKADQGWKPEKRQFSGNSDIFSDVLRLMEIHLGDVTNRNACTWSAYALRANQLHWLAPNWFALNVVGKLTISSVPSGQHAPWIFWLTFLKFQQAHRIWLKVFQATYTETVYWLQSIGIEEQEKIASLSDYLEHLMVYFWQGDLEIQSGGLIQSAFVNVSAVRRMQTMMFVGRSLDRGECPSPAIVERFQSLWSWYWHTFGIKDVRTRSAEQHRSSLFGDWLSSGHLGAEWSLKTFLNYLEHDAGADHGEDELKRLSEWYISSPLEVLMTTNRLVIGDQEGWRMHLWKGAVKAICDKSKASTNAEIMRARSALIESLIRRGHVDFSDGEVPEEKI